MDKGEYYKSVMKMTMKIIDKAMENNDGNTAKTLWGIVCDMKKKHGALKMTLKNDPILNGNK